MATPVSSYNKPTRAYFRLPFLIGAIALVTMTTWGIGWWYVEQSLLRTAGEALALGASEIAVKFDRMIFERYADMRVMSAVLSRRLDGEAPFIQAYLDRVRDSYGNYHWIGVADRTGRVIAASPPTLVGTDVSNAPWFREGRSRAVSQPDATYMGGVDAFFTEKGAPDTIALSSAIYDSAGTFQGVVSSRVSIPVLEAIAVETIRSLQGKDSTLADIEYQILDDHGIAYIDSDLLHKGRVNFSAMNLPSFQLSRWVQSGFLEEDHQHRKVRVMTGFSRTRGWGQPDPFYWTVLVRIPTGALVAPIQTFHFKIGAGGLAILIPIFWLLFWMQHRLSKEWCVAQAERFRAATAEAHYHVLLQTTDQGIFGLDGEGRCTFINRAAAAMLGYEAADLLGTRLHERLHRKDAGCTPEHCVVMRMLASGEGGRLAEQVFLRRDGASFDVECSAFPLEEAGSTTRYVFTFMDIAERKQRTYALLQYQERLQSLAGQLRRTEENVRQGLATELHDNLAQTLALCQMRLASLNRKLPVTLKTSLVPVTDLVKESLAYTRQLMSELRPPTLGNERDLAAAVQWVTAKLERHGLAITVVDDGKPKPLDPDILRVVHQSLHELLFNVLKHSCTASARVRLRRFGEYLIMDVRDRGIGFRNGGYKAPTQQGGFGLFNMREQIAAAGGRIRISSAPECGSSVSIVLPLRVVQPVVQGAAAGGQVAEKAAPTVFPAEPAAIRIRVLLVDDHQIMRQGLRSMIEAEQGYEVVGEAVDGEMAVELAGTLRPNVILMDINMPKLNGVEATRRIKHSFPEVSIIGLSMHEDPKLEQLMYEVGASAYLSKGTAFNLVCDTIRQAYHTPHQPA